MNDWLYDEPTGGPTADRVPRFDVPDGTTALICAASENGVIGQAGGLPWHLPDDMRFFKHMTAGHAMVMGRRTLETMDRPLPGRPHLVVTRRDDYQPAAAFREAAEPVRVFDDLSAAIEAGAAMDARGIVFVIGGAAIYRQALPLIDRAYLTRVHAEVEGDTHFDFFPERDPQWQRLAAREHAADEKHRFGFTFGVYQKVPRA